MPPTGEDLRLAFPTWGAKHPSGEIGRAGGNMSRDWEPTFVDWAKPPGKTERLVKGTAGVGGAGYFLPIRLRAPIVARPTASAAKPISGRAGKFAPTNAPRSVNRVLVKPPFDVRWI